MMIIDTNIILRYLLNDHKEYSEKSKQIISDNDVLIIGQVVAEVVYVLGVVYKVTREEMVDSLNYIFEMDNVHIENREILCEAIN